MSKARIQFPFLGHRGFTSILLLVVLSGLFILVFVFNGALQAKNAKLATKTAIRQNLIFIARNLAAAVDCETTTGRPPVNTASDLSNATACGGWNGQPATGISSSVPGHPFIQLFVYPRNAAPPALSTNSFTDPTADITYPGAVFDPVLGVTPRLRVRCATTGVGAGKYMVPEIQLLDINNNVSPWNYEFRNRNGWIDIYHNVDNVTNPFASKVACQFP